MLKGRKERGKEDRRTDIGQWTGAARWDDRGGKRGGRREKEVKERMIEEEGRARPVGRYFCACFVFNFSPPFAPRRGRRDAEQRSRGWLVCGCLSSYAYLSASHIDSGRHYAS